MQTRAWAQARASEISGQAQANFKPSPGQAWLGLERLGSAGSGLEARPSTSLLQQQYCTFVMRTGSGTTKANAILYRSWEMVGFNCTGNNKYRLLRADEAQLLYKYININTRPKKGKIPNILGVCTREHNITWAHIRVGKTRAPEISKRK